MLLFRFPLQVAGFLTERDRAASAAVGDTMVVLGGRAGDGEDIIGFEVFNVDTEQWEAKEEWEMAKGRYRWELACALCTVWLHDPLDNFVVSTINMCYCTCN